MALCFTIKPTTFGGYTYSAGQFVDIPDASSAAAVTAGYCVLAQTMDALAVMALVDQTASATALPAGSDVQWMFGGRKATSAPAPGAAITAAATVAAAGTVDTAATWTISGGPAKSAGSIVFTLKVGTAADQVFNINVAKGDTASAVAAALAAAAGAAVDVVVTAAGAVVTATPASGKGVAKMTIAVTATTR